MIIGLHPRTQVIGDTMSSRADCRRSAGIIVDPDAVRYQAYWRRAEGIFCRNVCRELAIPRTEYGRQWT